MGVAPPLLFPFRMKINSLSNLLKKTKAFKSNIDQEGKAYKREMQDLQLKMLRVQQGIWHSKNRAIIVFEGFDAAGKGGAIRKLTEVLDPRGIDVYPIGPPSPEEQSRHWLYRFWTKIPEQGIISIFDRSWYGRVLVERVDHLTEKGNWQRGYSEINNFEQMLRDDGIDVVKIFFAITKDEQLKRFKDRLNDPYKQWKLTKEDIKARKKWDQYVKAVDQMFRETSTKTSPWNLISANDKYFARKEVLKVVTSALKNHATWMEKQASRSGKQSLAKALRDLK